MNKQKQDGLVRALRIRTDMDQEPEPPIVEAPPKEPKPKKPPKVKAEGKRWHTSYYPESREFHDEVVIAMIRAGKGRELSELIDELLRKWLKTLER